MERQDYLQLRFDIEQEVSSAVIDEVEARSLVNSVMRHFLAAITGTEVKRQKMTKQFNDFKRSNQTKPPSWAFKYPALSDRIPTSREA